jgi:hypothetical protein
MVVREKRELPQPRNNYKNQKMILVFMLVNNISGKFCVLPDGVNGNCSSEVSAVSMSASFPSINHNEACMCSLLFS